MCSALDPPHLLLLDHTLAHDMVDRRLCWGTGDRLARLIAHAIIRNKRLIDLNVAPELVEPFSDLLPFLRGPKVAKVEISARYAAEILSNALFP